MSDPKNPWTHATAAERDYITPEDVEDARTAGAGKHDLMASVLDAIAWRQAEDARLCARYALDGVEWSFRNAPRVETALSAPKVESKP